MDPQKCKFYKSEFNSLLFFTSLFLLKLLFPYTLPASVIFFLPRELYTALSLLDLERSHGQPAVDRQQRRQHREAARPSRQDHRHAEKVKRNQGYIFCMTAGGKNEN